MGWLIALAVVVLICLAVGAYIVAADRRMNGHGDSDEQ